MEIIRDVLGRFPLEITDEALNRLKIFADFLLERNKVMNLTAIKNPDDVARRHMADSLFLYKCAELSGKSILDIGTGAGFPGMPLKLYDPSLDITMLDSTAKRIAFINEAAEMQNIDVKTIVGRAEDIAREDKDRYDIVTSRAVAPLNILAEISLPFVKKGGFFMPMKSHNEASYEEIKAAERAIDTLGGELRKSYIYSVEDGIERQVLAIEKVKETPKQYPRVYTQITKKPL